MAELPRFDVRNPLPMGTTTLLEASAGTGKTCSGTAARHACRRRSS